jgi:hypothetical protein
MEKYIKKKKKKLNKHKKLPLKEILIKISLIYLKINCSIKNKRIISLFQETK